jgi:hypothetical protein
MNMEFVIKIYGRYHSILREAISGINERPWYKKDNCAK